MINKGDRDYATAVDVEIERAIRKVLAEADPGIAFLGEEEGLTPAQAEALWVLDPIDGTINFSKSSPLCGISLALVEAGRPTLGIVDLPLLGERYVAREGGGAFVNGRRISVSEVAGLSEAVIGFADFAVGAGSASENALHLEIMRLLALECLRIRVHGSASLDLAWLCAGHLNASLMLSNLPWDVGAGVLLVREAGGEVYDLDGSPYSFGSTFTIASTPRLKEPLLTHRSGGLGRTRRLTRSIGLGRRDRPDLDVRQQALDLGPVPAAQAAPGRVERSGGHRQAQRLWKLATVAERDADRREHRVARAVMIERGEARARELEQAAARPGQGRPRPPGDEDAVGAQAPQRLDCLDQLLGLAALRVAAVDHLLVADLQQVEPPLQRGLGGPRRSGRRSPGDRSPAGRRRGAGRSPPAAPSRDAAP